MTGDAHAAGIEEHRRDDVTLRVYSVAKTVVDCFKHRNKVGLDVAMEALKDARAKRKATVDDLWRYAKICRVANVMRPYLEAIERTTSRHPCALLFALWYDMPHRGMAAPADLPVGLTDEFTHDHSRQALWQAFIKKNELAPEPLVAVVDRLRAVLELSVEPSRSMMTTT